MTDKQPDVLESVARAMWAAGWRMPFPEPETINHDLAMDVARAALSAVLANMREPSVHQRWAVVNARMDGKSCQDVVNAFLDQYRDENLVDNKGDTGS